MQFLAQKQMLPTNVRVDMYCQPTWVTQNAIPGELELILLGRGHYEPLPDKVGLSFFMKLQDKLITIRTFTH